MANGEAMIPDGPLAQLLRLGLIVEPSSILHHSHSIIVAAWTSSAGWKDHHDRSAKQRRWTGPSVVAMETDLSWHILKKFLNWWLLRW